MDIEEVIDDLQYLISRDCTDTQSDYVEEIRLAIKALERQVPRRYEVWNGQCCCPNCKKLFGSYDTLKTLISWEMPYCKYCGQKIDWSDEE